MGTLSGGGREVISIGRRSLLGANAGLGIPLGDDCVVEAGLYVTAGTKVTLVGFEDCARASSRPASSPGGDGLLFRRNSLTGGVEARRPRRARASQLNADAARQLRRAADGLVAAARRGAGASPCAAARRRARRARRVARRSGSSCVARPARRRRRRSPQRCVARRSTAPRWTLSPDQARQRRPHRRRSACSAACPRGRRRSRWPPRCRSPSCVNIDYGDRDSLGLFQQRPSQGWGTVEQIMDPVYATGAFYDGLVDGRRATRTCRSPRPPRPCSAPASPTPTPSTRRARARGRRRSPASPPAPLTCTLRDAGRRRRRPQARRGARRARPRRAARRRATPTRRRARRRRRRCARLPRTPTRLGWAVAQWAVVRRRSRWRSTAVERRRPDLGPRATGAWAPSSDAACRAGQRPAHRSPADAPGAGPLARLSARRAPRSRAPSAPV